MSSILEKIVRHKTVEIEVAKSKRALSSLQSLANKVKEPLDFVGALREKSDFVSLIAEVKKASPSKGLIRADFDPVEIAMAYQSNGASCISVLTDKEFFQGDLAYLTQIRAAVEIPLLRKDFVLDEYQVWEARAAGADAVLLIAECLTPDRMLSLHKLICKLGMTPLVELYDEANLMAVLECDPKLVGVNNRDLNTFEVNLQHSISIRKKLPADIVFVSESGIYTHDDVQLMQQSQVDAVLVGESLMRQQDVGLAVRNLLGN